MTTGKLIVQSDCRTTVTLRRCARSRSGKGGKAKMVYSSAYRRAYKEPSWDDYSKREFISRLQYRSDRRSVEHRHQPWSWDSDSEEEDIEEIPADDGSYDGGRRGRERAPREERIIEKREPKEAWGEQRREKKEPNHAADKALVLPERLTYEEQEEKKPKQSQVARDVSRPKERDRKKKDDRNQHRSSEDTRKHRSRSTSPAKNRKSKREKNKAPFLPYGMANEGPVDMWKTHNVLAAQQEVYPAALRAQKRRQQEVKKKAELREEAVRRKEKPAHFDADVAFPKTWWMTEYQRNFCKEEDVKRHFLR